MNSEAGNQGVIITGGTINAEQMAVGKKATVSGTVNKTIGELQNSDAPESQKLVDLIQQLQTAIETDPNLSTEAKVEALEQVAEIAKAGKSLGDGEMQKLAKTATRALKGMIVELPKAAQFVEACTSLLPLITKLFGF